VNRLTPTRRAFLRGSGCWLGLPWLEALAARTQGPVAPPRRLAILVMPNGVLPTAWQPTAQQGGGYEPSFALAALGPHQAATSVLTGLANRGSFTGDGHYAKVAPLLTGATIRRTGGRDLWNGVSCDQLAAQQLGGHTLLPSLELGCDPIYPVEDMGYSTVYGGNLAWAAPDRPVPKEIAPRRVFDRLCGLRRQSSAPGQRQVLDLVAAEARRLQARLPARDQQQLTAYLESVQALERRITAAAAAPAPATSPQDPAAPPPGVPADYPTHVEQMTDLIAWAFATDSTRVVTFLMANEVSGRDFAFVDGCAGGFHEFSHHEGKAEKQEAYRRINRWHVERFRSLLDKLAAVPEGEGTVLDHTMVVLASAMRDGNAHSPHDLPVLLAGGRGCGVPQGRLLTHQADTPLCRLWLALLQRLGVAAERFGDADSPLF
jgi:hypothetical protein